MKIRTGFVSNSSSSSFMVAKKYLTPEQIVLIKNHAEEGSKYGISYGPSDEWNITEHELYIEGYTWMDNFDMRSFLHRIGVDMDHVGWDGNQEW